MLLGSYISQETLEALPDAVGIYRIDGVLMADNAAFRRFWKLPPDHMLIGNLCLLTAPGVHPDHVAALLRAREGEVVTTAAVEIDLRADPAFAEVQNKQLWMENIFGPIRDPAGTIRYVMLIFRDRTADIRNQRRIQEAEQLIEAQRETIDALRSAQDVARYEHMRSRKRPVVLSRS
jgi:PAS domain-containing protein